MRMSLELPSWTMMMYVGRLISLIAGPKLDKNLCRLVLHSKLLGSGVGAVTDRTDNQSRHDGCWRTAWGTLLALDARYFENTMGIQRNSWIGSYQQLDASTPSTQYQCIAHSAVDA
jgi:hypothetical protein